MPPLRRLSRRVSIQRGRSGTYKLAAAWPTTPTDPAEPTSLVVLDQLPRNASGKVLKHELRVRYGRSRSQNGGSSV